jgi:putative PIN family toxin of toxin-antitoxin system
LRVVLDTNILISARLKPNGLEARVLDLALRGEIQPVATEWIWNEYEAVLERKNYAAVLPDLESRLAWCVAYERLAIASDESDNRFLEAAVSGSCDSLITGNAKHFPLEYKGVRVENARSFLARFDT